MNTLKPIALAAALSLGLSSAIAQTTTPTNPTTTTPPAAASKPTETPPVAGANSFTEAQAKDRIEKAGFTEVSNLRKGDDGIWRGSAKQGDKQVTVALDFRGNVVAQ